MSTLEKVPLLKEEKLDVQIMAERKSYTTAQRLIACLQYGAISTSITLFNRAVFSVYHFNYPSFVTLVQIVVSIVYMYALRSFNFLEFENVSWAKAKRIAPLAIFWWLYVVSGVTALRYLNVPMNSVLRRSTVILVVIGEWRLFSKRPTGRSLVALALMLGGATVAGLSDLTFSLPGYLWVSVCIFGTAAYLLLIRLLKDSTGMSQGSLLFYNNVLALPLMAAFLVLGTNELEGVLAFPRLLEPQFVAFLLLSCSQAFLLNLCIFRCTLVNSPLATNVTGQIKDIATTALGMVLFSDVIYTAANVAGILVGLVGSIGYSIVGYLDSQVAAAPRLPLSRSSGSNGSGQRTAA